MISKKYLIVFCILLICSAAYSQLRIPTFDVEVKFQQTLVPSDGSEDGELEFVETTNFYGAAHVQINQYVAIGGYYSRSFRGMASFRSGEDNASYQALQLQTGLDLRLSTSRAKKWRWYMDLNYGKIELVSVNESFRLSDKTNAFGGSLGIMRRLNNNLYLNVFELGVKVMSDTMFWFGTEDTKLVMLDAKIGVTYIIGKRK